VAGQDRGPARGGRSALRRLTGGFPALYRASTRELQRLDADTGPFTGPPTSAQMMALRQLEYISSVQVSALDTAMAPLREGRRGALAALWRGRRRLLTFAANGLFVFVFGVAVQYLLIHRVGMSHIASYIIQTVLSVQLNFLLSRYLTWRDRTLRLLPALVRFNIQQLATTGVGIGLYAGLDHFGMNYVAGNVVVTAVLTPASFVLGDRWSMTDRTARFSLRALPWPLLAIVAVQVLLSLRLIWTNTAYTDEALYLYSGSQELNHWIHGTMVEDYQKFFSGAPVVYPPLAAIANAVGGLTGARLLSLGFMAGTTSLLYATCNRLFGKSAAVLGTAMFAALGVTQFLSAFATYDPMALFLLVLSAYLVVGRAQAYDTLTDVAYSTVIAALCLALANADKYATALWDPIVVGLALCAPVVHGYPWRYGFGRALRFTATVAAFVIIGLAVGKAKYVTGILTTTVARSSTQVGMGQPASLVVQDAWRWVGPVLAIALIGAIILLFLGGRVASGSKGRGAVALMGMLLFLAAVAAPLNQARIGTTVSLQKHVDFGAWFGCILVGYALSVILRYRVLVGVAAASLVLLVSVAFTGQSAQLYTSWPQENPVFIHALRPMLTPGTQKYLIEGYSAIPAYYIGSSINSLQWKDEVNFSYTDPGTGVTYGGDQAFADAIQHRAFNLIILNFVDTQDYTIVADIAKYGGYTFAAHLPPSAYGSSNYYTVWRVAKGKLWDSKLISSCRSAASPLPCSWRFASASGSATAVTMVISSASASL
jgi:putative flippase GtrA